MLQNHWQNNPCKITRQQKQKLVNIFWSRHKLHPYNNEFHPNHRHANPPEYDERDITQLYEYPYNILNWGIGGDDQLGMVAATAPFNPHKDTDYKKYGYLLILYNEGTIVVGERQNPSYLPPQKELDLLLIDQHQTHQLSEDIRAFTRMPATEKSLSKNLFLAIYFCSDSIIKTEKAISTLQNQVLKMTTYFGH